ncbi:hypothetical protein GUJ93_ZPchr0004g38413 [Zizania palustris]|uniref:RING-type E3 ubiquitin transferase n=1 Tax=Zizania palustris TaxID=103762 RepID=A0A8J5SZL8_ZIZPA|nr:hypothetical protein GUJ93_ZPchr0004g38413 [Zizania palustris]
MYTPSQAAGRQARGRDMSSLTVENTGAPTVVVDGDVVLSGVVLVFVILAFVFVVHHFLAAVRGGRGQRDAAAADAVGRSTSNGGDVGVGAASACGKGVDPVVLRALPVTVYSAKDFAEKALECAVCLAGLADGEAARFLPKCGHGFHAECVDQWLLSHSTCPLCRVGVVGDKPAGAPPLSALPSEQPEPANYSTSLPTNVLFWGSQGGVTTTATSRATAVDVAGSTSSSSGAGTAAALVIEVPETTTGGAAKPRGSARLSGSLRRMWSRPPRS